MLQSFSQISWIEGLTNPQLSVISISFSSIPGALWADAALSWFFRWFSSFLYVDIFISSHYTCSYFAHSVRQWPCDVPLWQGIIVYWSASPILVPTNRSHLESRLLYLLGTTFCICSVPYANCARSRTPTAGSRVGSSSRMGRMKSEGRTYPHTQTMVEVVNLTSSHASDVLFVHIGFEIALQNQTMRQTYSLRNVQESWSQFPAKGEWYYGTKRAGHGRSVWSCKWPCTWSIIYLHSVLRYEFIRSNYASTADIVSMECPRELKSIPD